MTCPSCQHANPPESNFCLGCGGRLAVACASCGTPLPAGSRFCNKCGTAVTAEAGVPARFTSPESYTPRHLAEKILMSKAALEGERKQVTVLFADLKGSMELLADRDPEEARKLLDPVIELMMEAVHRYEGTVNQVMGDGIMALFGAPLAHEDHAVRACYAALRMQESARTYAEEVRRSHAAVVKIRVGLNSGEVVVRAIGSDLHMDYTAVGQTTHLAARMEQIADPGAIVITPDTLALAEGYIEVKSLGPVPVKGLAAAVQVYEVTGAGPARTRLQAGARRGLTRFVGRDAELEQLRRAQQLASTGHGQVAALVGEAGVGKSRLVYEFTHSHRLQGWLVLESASVSYGKATSYLPVIDLLKGYFRIQDRDDPREIREKVTGKLLTLDEALKPTLPALLALLDVPVDDAAWRTLDPAGRRQRTLDAVKRLLLREAREQPLLLIFEDLHWIDSETQALLDTLVDSLGSARLLLVVNYRPEYHHAWGSKTSYSQMRLDTLPAESAGELLDALLGDDPELAPLKHLLVKRGNPFFLEETVRTLVETEALAGERGQYRLRQPVQQIQVPPTVQAMLAARIDRLAPGDKRLLQTASVIGKDVPFAILTAIAELPEEALRRALGHLQEVEFLYETSLFPELEYTFKHALTHEVAYQSLLKTTREQYHGRIAQVLEERFPETKDTRPEWLAHHYTQAARTEQAIAYWQRAGAKALQRSANVEAVSHLGMALELLKTLPDTPARARQELDVQTALGAALMVTSPRGYAAPEVQRAYARARELCEQLEDAPGLFPVLLGMRIVHLTLGQHLTALELAERLLVLANRVEDPALLLEAHRAMGETLYYLGRLASARPHLERALPLDASLQHRSRPFLVGQSIGHSGVFCGVHLAFALWLLGYPDLALRWSQDALTLARELDDAQSIAFALHGRCTVLQNRREGRAVGELAEALIEISSERFPYWTMYGRLYRDWALVEQGGGLEPIARMRQELATIEAVGTLIALPYHLTRLAELHGKAGRAEEGLTVIVEAIAMAERNDEHDYIAESYCVKGELLLRQAVPDEHQAESCFHHAIDVARRQGAKSLELRAAMRLSRLWQQQGRREEARQLLTEVHGWFTEGFDTPDLKDSEALLEELT